MRIVDPIDGIIRSRQAALMHIPIADAFRKRDIAHGRRSNAQLAQYRLDARVIGNPGIEGFIQIHPLRGNRRAAADVVEDEG